MNRLIPLFLAISGSLVVAACGGGGSGGGGSGSVAVSPTKLDCSALRGMVIAGATVSSALMVNSGTSPYCSLIASMGPQTQFEMRLPTNWQGRYLHVGGGSFDGILPNLDENSRGAVTALARNYAIVASNGGHVGDPNQPGGPIYDLTWALNNTPALLDFTYRAIGTVDTAAKAIIAAYYTNPIQYSYFSGCSAGGREAINAAVYFPQNYDGIIAGSPAIAQAGSLAARMQAHNQIFGAPNAFLTDAVIARVDAATLSACDALDGVQDGIISNPAACKFDVASLSCSTGAVGCLTDSQLASVQTIRQDTKLSTGETIYAAYGLGAESYAPGNWQLYTITGSVADTAPENYLLANAMLKYVVFKDPNYDARTFDVDRDYPRVLQAFTVVNWQLNAGDLQAYAAAGKKLILWQPESDYSVSANEAIRFYGDLTTAVGGAAQAAAFSRLYVMPGVQHCGNGPGADQFDKIGAISDWVERGIAPQALTASHSNPQTGILEFTRPICPFPQYTRYVGGTASSAQSFACATN